MSWLEDYNGEGARWWHILLLLLLIFVPIFLIVFFTDSFSGDIVSGE